MSNPLISVIVPVYNVKDYLSDCLGSLKQQTYKDLEIILVDDGSDDGSGEILDEYMKNDKRMVVFHKKNGGLSSARNFGLKKATGEYITFVDSDDYLEKDAIEYLYGLIKRDESVIAVASHKEKKENGEVRDFNNGEESDELTVEEALKRMLNERGFMVSAWGKLYEKRLLKGITFPEGKLHEDVGTTYKIFLAAYKTDELAKVSYGEKAKYIYNIRSSSITNAGFDSRKLELITQTDEMCNEIEKVFPGLINTLNLRRVHARFSILRQIGKSKGVSRLENELIHYIKEHKKWVTRNPEAGKRDKLAVYSLSMGKRVFYSSWKVYEKIFK